MGLHLEVNNLAGHLNFASVFARRRPFQRQFKFQVIKTNLDILECGIVGHNLEHAEDQVLGFALSQRRATVVG